MNRLINDPRSRQQQGLTMFMAMIFLIVLSLLAIVSIRGLILQERMAGNTQDWNLAFQAAEAALRDAENDIATSGRVIGDAGFANPCPTSGSNVGLCLPSATGIPIWTSMANSNDTTNYDPNWVGNTGTGYSVAYGAQTNTGQFPGVNRQPRYIIENLGAVGARSLVLGGYGDDSPRSYAYRITAVGFGNIQNNNGTPATRVVLQSVYQS